MQFKIRERFNAVSKHEWILVGILSVFCIIFGLISFVNHYNFRTNAHDLGIFNHGLYHYARFSAEPVTTLYPHYHLPHLLADHFSIFPMLISPLYHIFGTHTLLIVQILALLMGGIGVYRLAGLYVSPKLALLAPVHLFFMWSVYSALSFDYHDNVVAAMLMPWLLYYFTKQKTKSTILFFILILVTRESACFWVGFVMLGMLLLNWKNKPKRKMAMILSGVGFFYFILVFKVFIPAFANTEEGFIHFEYSALGGSFGEAISFMVSNPIESIKLLFVNHSGDPIFDGIKMELHYGVLLSGGIFLFIRPQFLLMLLPIYAQKLYTDDPQRWGINYHYSIEFSVILVIAAFYVISKVKAKKYQTIAISLTVLVTFLFTLIKLESRKSVWYHKETILFYSGRHYKREFDVSKGHEALSKIPDGATVSSHACMVSHLPQRKKLYVFPHVDDAEYIVIPPAGGVYPFPNQEALENEINRYKGTDEWETIMDGDVVLLKKKKL